MLPILVVIFSLSSQVVSFAVLCLIIFASLLGFLCASARIENWLYGISLNLSRSDNDLILFRIPKVTPVELYAISIFVLECARKDWNVALENAYEIWLYTRQHKAVARGLYQYIEECSKEDPDQLIKLVADLSSPKYNEWRPRWFVQGGTTDLESASKGILFSNRQTADTSITRKIKSLSSKEQSRYLPIFASRNELDLALVAFEQKRKGDLSGGAEILQGFITSRHAKELTALLNILNRLKEIGNVLHIENLDFPSRPYESYYPNDWTLIEQLHIVCRHAWLFKRCQSMSSRRHISSIIQGKMNSILHCQEISSSMEGATVEKIVDVWLESLSSWRDINEVVEFNLEANPFKYSEPLRETDIFRGRNAKYRELRRAWNYDHIHPVQVHGPILAGKTSFIWTAIGKLKFEGEVAYVSLKNLNTEISFPARVIYAIYDELIMAVQPLEVKEEDFVKEPFRTLERIVRYICQHSMNSLIIIMDDFDRMDELVELPIEFEQFMRFLNHLSETLPNFGLLVSGDFVKPNMYRRYKTYVSKYARPIHIDLFGVGSSDVQSLLDRPNNDFRCIFAPEVVQWINDWTDGHPYLIQLVAWSLVEQFYREYEKPLERSMPQNGRYYDPFFMEEDIQDILNNSAFQHGLSYYFNRLKNYFGEDSNAVETIVDRFMLSPHTSVTLADIAAYLQDEAQVDKDYLLELSDTLVKQGVLKQSGGKYELRLKLLHYYRSDEE